jgi:hypothetical protein
VIADISSNDAVVLVAAVGAGFTFLGVLVTVYFNYRLGRLDKKADHVSWQVRTPDDQPKLGELVSDVQQSLTPGDQVNSQCAGQ